MIGRKGRQQSGDMVGFFPQQEMGTCEDSENIQQVTNKEGFCCCSCCVFFFLNFNRKINQFIEQLGNIKSVT